MSSTTELNKKDKVRTAILQSRDGYAFSHAGMAERLMVDIKAVSNVTAELVRTGALKREQRKVAGRNVWYYIVDANATALWFAKNPIGQRPVINKPKAVAPATPATKQTRRKARSPLVIGIDNEIAALERKLKRLHTLRKEFAE